MRPQLVLRQRGHLVHQKLARGHSLLRHLYQRLGLQCLDVSLIYAQQHVVAGGLILLGTGLGLQPGAGHQVARAARIGDDLAQCDPLAKAVPHTRGHKVTRADARLRIPLRAGDVALERWEVCRTRFRYRLLGCL